MKTSIPLLLLLTSLCIWGQKDLFVDELLQNNFKADETEVILVDSLLIVSTHKTKEQRTSGINFSYTYDSLDNSLSEAYIAFYDSTSNQWNYWFKGEYTFNESGKLTELDAYFWDDTLNIWLNTAKSAFFYNTEGIKTEELIYGWDEIEAEWEFSSKNSREINDAGLCTQKTDYYWDDVANDWAPNYRTDSTYDDNSNLLEHINYIWDVNVNNWMPYYREKSTYDEANNLIEFIIYEQSTFVDVNDTLLPSTKTVYEYDSIGNQITKELSYYDYVDFEWMEYSRLKRSYSYQDYETSELIWPADSMISQSYYVKDYYPTESWTIQSSSYLVFDVDRPELITLISQSRDAVFDTLLTVEKRERFYDDFRLVKGINYNVIDTTLIPNEKFENSYYEQDTIEVRTTFAWNHLDSLWTPDTRLATYAVDTVVELLISEWNEEGNAWDFTGWLGSYFTIKQLAETLGLTSLNNFSINVFPNPTTDNIQINFAEGYQQLDFELTDLNGRTLHSQKVQNNEIIQLESLTKGLYLYHLHIDGKRQSGKLIKK